MYKEQEIYQGLIDRGMSPHIAAGFTGNFVAESGLRTDISGDNGTSYGLAQWHNERKTALNNFSKGKKGSPLDIQLDFVMHELATTHKGVANRLKSAKNVDDASKIVTLYYEIPLDREKKANERLVHSRKVFSGGGGDYKPQKEEEEANPYTIDFGDSQVAKNSGDTYSVADYNEAEQEIEKKQTQENNENAFLSEMQQIQQNSQQQLPNEPQQTYLQDSSSFQVGEFQDGGQYFQSGGTWSSQQERVNQEKLAKLRRLLVKQKNNPQTNQRTIPLQERRGEVARGSTNVSYDNRPAQSRVARNKTDEEIAFDRRQVAEKSDNNVLNGIGFLNPDNHTRQNWADVTASMESKYRLSDKPNFFDEYLNVPSQIAGMGASLGSAPLRAQQEDSYMPYVTGVAAPMAFGALAGIGAQGYKQFANNVVNPLAGTGNLVKGLGKRFTREFPIPNMGSTVDDVAGRLQQQIDDLKVRESSASDAQNRLMQDYRAKKIDKEQYAREYSKFKDELPGNNNRIDLEKELRQYNIKQGVINTPQKEILKSESQLGENISSGGSNTKGVFVIDDAHVARLSSHGYDDASTLVNYTDKIKSPRTAKTLQVKEFDGKVYQVQDRATGKSIADLSEQEFKNIPEEHITNFWKDKAELDDLGLTIDVSGKKANILYDQKKGFQIIDLGIGESTINKDIIEAYSGLKPITKNSVTDTPLFFTNRGEGRSFSRNLEDYPISLQSVNREASQVPRRQFIQQEQNVLPLREELTPYTSSKVLPISRDREVFENSLGVEYYNKLLKDRTVMYDKDGNIIKDSTHPETLQDGGIFLTQDGYLKRVIEDDRGQWSHPGEITRINGGNITMQGVSYPVIGVSDKGEQKMMYPNKNYRFNNANYVTEFPQNKK